MYLESRYDPGRSLASLGLCLEPGRLEGLFPVFPSHQRPVVVYTVKASRQSFVWFSLIPLVHLISGADALHEPGPRSRPLDEGFVCFWLWHGGPSRGSSGVKGRLILSRTRLLICLYASVSATGKPSTKFILFAL